MKSDALVMIKVIDEAVSLLDRFEESYRSGEEGELALIHI